MSMALLLTVLATANSPSFVFDARLAAGLGTRLDKDEQTELLLELGALGRIPLRDRNGSMVPTLLPELSVVVLAREKGHDDFGVLGFGYGWMSGPFVLGFVPGIVVGTFRGDEVGDRNRVGAGLRLMAIAEITHFIGLQAGYIGAYSGNGFRNEFYASLSINFLGLATLYIIGNH